MELIWDFDGTLFDTYPLMADSLRRAMLEEGHDVPLQDIRARMAVTLGDAVAHYKRTLGITEGTMERYRRIMYAQGWRAARPFAGAEDVCARVVREGGHNHLCTHRGVTARQYMEAWGLDRYFSVYVTDEDGLPRKPAPDMVRRILDVTGRPAQDFLMIGDRELDILAAQAAGVRGCRFTEGKAGIQTAAEYTVARLEDIFDVIAEGGTEQ